MRYALRFLFVCALGVAPMVGCSEAEGPPPECRTDAECDEQNECTADFCDLGGSCSWQSSELNGDPCDLNGAPGICVGGVCGECQSNEDCDDQSECTLDACIDGVCEHTAVADDTPCDESNECTVGVCASGVCDSTPVPDGTTCGDGVGTCCSGACIPEILPVLDGANGIQASVFQASCAFSACHGSNVVPQAGLELSSASVSEANLINVDSTQVDKLRVAPGDPDASYLLDKLLGRNLAPGTLQQPPVGGPLCDPMIQAVEEWIAAGAI